MAAKPIFVGFKEDDGRLKIAGRCAASPQLRMGASSAADRDAAWFLPEVVPKLDALSLSAIAEATGLSHPGRVAWPPIAMRRGSCAK